ncbi:MAG TPA: hypothetical protein VMJ65_05450 [Solirubrobacteraceae bacterium]|nr:hypothetical protein [Solirubrobacteraceae bacterium]
MTAILSAWRLCATSAAVAQTVKVEVASDSIVADGNSAQHRSAVVTSGGSGSRATSSEVDA